jgi:hypothetical protein
MMRWSLSLACLALACTLRGDGEEGSATRELAVFTGIEVFDGFTATVTVDPATPVVDGKVEVRVTGDSNALERLFTVLHAVATLSAGVDPNHITELSLTPGLSTTVPALRSGYVADTSTLEVFGASGELTLSVHEAGSLMVHDGELLSVTATVVDDGLLTLAGSGPLLELVVEGAAAVEAGAFAAAKVVVHARGTGSVRVCATEAITILGAGAELVEFDCG